MIKEIKFTDKALKQIDNLLSKKDKGSFFRIAIKGGGCSGFQYNLSFDLWNDDDVVFDVKNIFKIIVDKRSFLYVAGSQINYEDGLMGNGFVISNPKANSTCGCGESFSI